MPYPHLMHGRSRWTAALAVAALALTACGGGDDGTDGAAASGPAKTQLVVAQTADTRSLFGNSSTNQLEINISEQINEKLVEFTADGKGIEPRLATEWKQVDPLTLRLTLREGVTFTNGEVFDAESAKRSVEVMLAAPAYASFSSSIAGAEVVDPNTLDVIAKAPTDLVLTSLAMGSFQYPKAYFDQVKVEGFATAPIGTGPYTFDSQVKGIKLLLKKNPSYWDGDPAFETVEFRVIPDKAAQVAALQSGEVDVVIDLPRGSIDQVKADDDLKVETRPSNRIYYASFNTLQPGPLQNPKVRQALQHAVDTSTLIKGALNGYGTPLKGQITSEAFFGHDPSRQPVKYDPARAKQLLAEAGYPDGFEIPLQYSVTNIKEVGQALAAQLENVGLTVRQDLLEPGTFLQNLTAQKLEGIFYAGSLPPPDAHFMYQQFESTFRYSYYKNPKVDALIKQELASNNKEERQRVFKDMLKEFEASPAFIPLFQGEDAYGLSTSVKGFTPRASQFLDLKAMRG